MATTPIDTAAKSFYHQKAFTTASMFADANAAVQATYKSDWGRIVATLIKTFGDFDLAEDAAQEAFAAAVNQWRVEAYLIRHPPGSFKRRGIKSSTVFAGKQIFSRNSNRIRTNCLLRLSSPN